MAFGLTGRFFGQLTLCFRQGMPMVRALDLIAGDCPDPEWSEALGKVRDRINAGESLTTAIEALPSSFERDVLPFLEAAEQEGLLEQVCGTLAAWPDTGATGLDACLARSLAEASFRLRRGETLLDALRGARRRHDPGPLGAALEALGKTVFGPETPDEVLARFPGVFSPALRTILHEVFQAGNVETAFAELALALSRGWFAPRGGEEGDVVAVLEDDLEGRQPQFRRAVELLGLRCVVHDNAPDFVAWLERSFASIRLASLDHDLGPSRDRNGGRFDPGSGMQVVDALLQRRPSFPVIVHSSNPYDAPTMVRRLEEAGWTSQRIVPWGEEWIPTLWLELARTWARPRA